MRGWSGLGIDLVMIGVLVAEVDCTEVRRGYFGGGCVGHVKSVSLEVCIRFFFWNLFN